MHWIGDYIFSLRKKFVFDYFMLPWVDAYYQAGAIEKGDSVFNLIATRYLEDLDYYSSLNDNKIEYYNEQIQESLAVLQRLGQVAEENKRKDLVDEMQQALIDNLGRFNLR